MQPVLPTAVVSEYQDFENQYYSHEMESADVTFILTKEKLIFKEHLPGARHGAE